MLLKQKKGFTIVELIVVMAIIGILVLLAMPKFMGYTEKARLTEIKNNIKQIENASERYYIKEQDWPRASDQYYTSEQLENFAKEIADKTGAVITLDPDGKYYPISYNKLQKYVQEPKDGVHYILQNPIGEVFYLDDLTEEGDKFLQDKNKDEKENRKPLAIITVSSQLIMVNSPVVFSYNNSIDTDGDKIINAEWEGTQEVYTSEGPYIVKLRVQDEHGLWSDWVEKEITVVNNNFKHALKFDGNDYIQLNKGYVKTPSTFEAYIKVPKTIKNTTRVGIILGNYSSSQNINFEVYSYGNPRIFWNDGQIDWVVKDVDVRNDEFTHIAFVRDTNTNMFYFYLNGVLVSTKSSIGKTVLPTAKLRIGADNRTTSYNFNGLMKYVRVWDRPLSQEEISKNIDNLILDDNNGLIGYWSFEEGSGNSISDLSPIKNDGTIKGATWVDIE